MKVRAAAIVLAMFVVGLAMGCASNPAAGTAPAIAHYGADVTEAMKVATDGVIALNQKGALSNELTRTILDNIEKANNAAGRLEAALRAYDAAEAIAKPQSLADVTKVVNEVSALFGQAFNVQVPASVVTQINALTANVGKTVLAIQTEIAKVKAS